MHTAFTNTKEGIVIFTFKKQVYSKKIIGVGSVERGLGSTHIALTLANYVCSKLGMKTAYIELNNTNHIHTLCHKKDKPSFRYKNIRFFPNVGITSLSEILHMDYQFFILDIGVLNTYTIREFLRCDKQLLVCSSSKWRCSQITEKLEKLFQNLSYRNCTVIVNFCEEESTISTFLKSCEHLTFPFLPNPFQIKTCNFHAIERFLKF